MVQRWEYAQVAEGLVNFSNPKRTQQRITNFHMALQALGEMGFELVSAYGVSNITQLGAGLTTTIGIGIGTTGRQKVESTTEHYMWFKRPMAEGE